MYEELVNTLRQQCVDMDCGNCNTCVKRKAADAIEKLRKVANKLLAKYQEEATAVIWEYSGHIDENLDFLHEEIRILQAQIDGKPEPPKKET